MWFGVKNEIKIEFYNLWSWDTEYFKHNNKETMFSILSCGQQWPYKYDIFPLFPIIA